LFTFQGELKRVCDLFTFQRGVNNGEISIEHY